MQQICNKNIKYIDYFDNKSANRTLYKATIKLMRHAIKYGGNETLMLLDTDTKECMITSQQYEISVSFTPLMYEKLNSNIRNNKYAVLHNHPYGGTFSYMDIVQFLRYPRIKILIACSNDCKQYFILYKTSTVNDLKLFEVSQKLERIIQKNNIEHDSFLPILNQLEENGIDYAEYL